MFPYFLLLSTCCVLLLPYIFTLPSLNIFAGGCTQSGQLQSKSRVKSGDGSPLSPWYPDIGHSALSTLAPVSGPRYGQGPDQQMHSRHTRADILQTPSLLLFCASLKYSIDIRASFDVVWLFIKNIKRLGYQSKNIRLRYQYFLLLQNTHRSWHWSPGIAPIMV